MRPKGFSRKLKVLNFSTVAMLCDVLSVITKLSEVFQKESVDIGQMNDMLACCKIHFSCM